MGGAAGLGTLHAAARLAGAVGALCRTRHCDDLHWNADPGRHSGGRGCLGSEARWGQPGRGHARHDSTGTAYSCHRLLSLRLVAHGAGHRPLELFAGALGLHHLYSSRLELVRCDVASVPLLLLWYATTAWP